METLPCKMCEGWGVTSYAAGGEPNQCSVCRGAGVRPNRVLYVSRYSLTEGVFAVNVGPRIWSDKDEELYFRWGGEGYFKQVKPSEIGRYYHETEAQAVEEAERLRKAKIQSLKKQMAELEALQFEVKGLRPC